MCTLHLAVWVGTGIISAADVPSEGLRFAFSSDESSYPWPWACHLRRYDKMEELMEWLARNELLRESHDMLVAYLDLLTALASTPEGAREVTQQLAQVQGSYDIVSWERMFSVITLIRQRYTDTIENKVQHHHLQNDQFRHVRGGAK